MKHRHSQKIIGVSCLLLSALFISAGSATASLSPQDLSQTILLLDRARTNGIIEFQASLSEKNLTEVEEKEYRTFLNYLTRRIHHYCSEIEKTVTTAAFAELPCSYMETDTLPEYTSLPPPPQENTTVSEQVNSLEGSLEQSLGHFDEMLLRENEQIAVQKSTQNQRISSSAATDGSSAGTSDSGTGGKSGKGTSGTKSSRPETQGDTAPKGTGTGNEVTKDKKSNKQSGMHKDDDIVARQLREAAEKETDPEIKEKLWEEYRKYKEGVR